MLSRCATVLITTALFRNYTSCMRAAKVVWTCASRCMALVEYFEATTSRGFAVHASFSRLVFSLLGFHGPSFSCPAFSVLMDTVTPSCMSEKLILKHAV